MSLMRAIAQHYAAQVGPKNLTVPAERFTEGHRSQLDTLPAIVYSRSSEVEDYHQQGAGFARTTVEVTTYGQTPAQAARIAEEIRNLFHLFRGEMGSGEDLMVVRHAIIESTLDVSNYPIDEGADFENYVTQYIVFLFRATQPTHGA